MGCPERVIEISRAIHRTDRYAATRLPKRLEVEIRQYAAECDVYTAIYLRILADWVLGRRKYPSTIKRLRRLTKSSRSTNEALAYSLSFYAKLLYQGEQTHNTYPHRETALRYARVEGLNLLELVILANWTIVALELQDQVTAELRFKDVKEKLASLPQNLQDDPVVDEVRGRLAAIHGKILLRALMTKETHTEVLTGIEKAKALYDEALAIDPSNPHRQVHSRLEFADEVLNLRKKALPLGLKIVSHSLDEAQVGLHAHTCRPCEALYYAARSKQHRLEGKLAMCHNLTLAAEHWRNAIELAERSARIYEELGHPIASEPRQAALELRSLLEMTERPRKIFLSHSSKDKLLARNFKETLELLGFEPWLDEEAMAAGVVLERGLLEGMEQSCAAVFFITANFKDRAYLATEIEYAIQQKRRKGNHFAIITLVLGELDKPGEVPALLRNYIWKEPSNQLEALRELIRALPLAPVVPQWRDSTEI